MFVWAGDLLGLFWGGGEREEDCCCWDEKGVVVGVSEGGRVGGEGGTAVVDEERGFFFLYDLSSKSKDPLSRSWAVKDVLLPVNGPSFFLFLHAR